LTLADLISYLGATGCRLGRAGDRLTLEVPEGHPGVPIDVTAFLRERRDELLASFGPAPEPAPPEPAPPEPAPPEPEPVAPFTRWEGEDLGSLVAIDTETEMAGNNPGDPPPRLVLVTAYNGEGGVFFGPDQADAFLRLHGAAVLVFHNAAFDLPVIEKALLESGSDLDLETFVDRDQVRDTYLLELLLELATTGRAQEDLKGKATLAALAKKYLGRDLDKSDGIRHTFDEYLGRPVTEIDAEHLAYAAADTVATYQVWLRQGRELDRIRLLARSAYGYTSPEALEKAWAKYGPLSLFVQTKTALAFRAMSRNGLWSDSSRRDETAATLEKVIVETSAILAAAGIPTEAKAKGKTSGKVTAIQNYIVAKEDELFAAGKLSRRLKRTASGKVCLDLEQRLELAEAELDPVITAYARREQAVKFSNTYLAKLGGGALHPRWKYLTRSGRASCDGDLAAQTLPRDDSGTTGTFSVRQCVIPPPGHVFVGADYATLEVRGFAYCLETQLGFGSSLADVVRRGIDVHAAVAMFMIPDRIGPVSARERKKVKATVFGLPGTLSLAGLKRSAKLQYGTVLEDHEVEEIVRAYKRLCPEVDRHLANDGNLGGKIATAFGLANRNHGWTLFKVLKGKTEIDTEKAAPYWKVAEKVLELAGLGPIKRKKISALIEAKQPSEALAGLVRMVADRGSYLSATGRLRAGAKFGASRNGVFQSVCADGALLAAWNLHRAGYRLSAFIHDEILVSVEEDGKYVGHVETVSRIMRDTMSEVLGGLPIEVEPFVRKSLSPRDSIPWETELEAEPLPPADFFCAAPAAKPEPPPGEEVDEEGGLLVGLTFGPGRAKKGEKRSHGPGKIVCDRGRRGRPAKDVSRDPLTEQDFPF
jgi:ribonuclease D